MPRSSWPPWRCGRRADRSRLVRARARANYLAQALLAQAVARTLTPTLDPNPSPSATVVELTTRVRAKGDVRVHGGHRVRHEEDEAVGRAVQKARVAAPACRAHL